MTSKDSKDISTFDINGEMTIYRATELKEALVGQINAGKPLEIDLSGVTEIDSAGVQLLMMAKHAAHAKQQKMKLVNESAMVLEVLELLNLAGYFNEDPEASISSAVH
jgi:anti-sigma B factor antagonist